VKKQKLELTWIGKNEQSKLEPRILIEDPGKSYHAGKRVGANDIFDNKLIFGDNLLALKALEQEFCGKVKCIYIDPPYNTGSAFEHYDDGIEHSLWLSLMRDRLVILRSLLREDGFIFIQIDNNEMAYLKVMLDEIFGRSNFVNDIVWKRRGGSANPNNRLNNVTDYILWYSKSTDYQIKPIFSKDDEVTQTYIAERFNGEFDGRKYMLAPIERNEKLGLRETMRYEYNGYVPKWGWMMSRENLEKMDKENKLHWNSKGRPNRRVFLEEYEGQPIGNLWTDIKVINPMALERQNFDGQKPEALIQRILTLTTEPGDLVLDSFGGSGSTAAAAHKMGRRWITIELGEHCHTHIIPRLQKVIDGSDQGGISGSLNWKGGGGFRYYRLAPSLLEKDAWGNWIISREFNSNMLAEAVCKLNGFTYAPSDSNFWQHGHSTERDFIYVTTQTLTREQLAKISEEVGHSQSLLICCGAFRVNADSFPNLTLKKIPKAVMSRCEWGRDDYSLKITELPLAEIIQEPVETSNRHKPRNKKERRATSTQGQLGLFERGK
jgi:adenine-specific DNA-methyltransferase